MKEAPRVQTLREEFANAATHGAGLVASIAAIPILISAAVGAHDAWQVAGRAVFGATLVLLYLMSTLYHTVRSDRAKRILRTLDHSAIFLLIAGTYTPFTLGPLRGPWGWSLLVAIWTLAVFGICAKFTLGFRFPRLSTALYITMGWLVIVAIQPLATQLSSAGLAWLIAGGLSYTVGVVFFVLDNRLRYSHALWHVFVVGGSVCHFLAVLRHAVAPVA